MIGVVTVIAACEAPEETPVAGPLASTDERMSDPEYNAAFAAWEQADHAQADAYDAYMACVESHDPAAAEILRSGGALNLDIFDTRRACPAERETLFTTQETLAAADETLAEQEARFDQ